MYKQILYLFIALHFLPLSFVYSQSLKTDEADINFINSLNNAGLKEGVINKIKLLLVQKHETPFGTESFGRIQKLNIPFSFRDDKIIEEFHTR